MDPRLEFVFQLLIDHTGLPRNSVMDYVFESNMVIIRIRERPGVCLLAAN